MVTEARVLIGKLDGFVRIIRLAHRANGLICRQIFGFYLLLSLPLGLLRENGALHRSPSDLLILFPFDDLLFGLSVVFYREHARTFDEVLVWVPAGFEFHSRVLRHALSAAKILPCLAGIFIWCA